MAPAPGGTIVTNQRLVLIELSLKSSSIVGTAEASTAAEPNIDTIASDPPGLDPPVIIVLGPGKSRFVKLTPLSRLKDAVTSFVKSSNVRRNITRCTPVRSTGTEWLTGGNGGNCACAFIEEMGPELVI